MNPDLNVLGHKGRMKEGRQQNDVRVRSARKVEEDVNEGVTVFRKVKSEQARD